MCPAPVSLDVGLIRLFKGRELGPAAEAAMRGWLASNKRDKHGRHKFSLRDFGIDVENDPVFVAYRAAFTPKRAHTPSGHDITEG